MEIGAKLKEAREAQNISLDTLQETTKIQKRYLVAIEEGNFHILPGKFYARAFIKEYATAVGLDSNELLMEYSEDIPKTEDESEVKYTRIQRTRKESNSEKSPAIYSLIPTVIVVLLIIGIIIAAVVLYNKTTADNSSDPLEKDDDNQVIINNSGDDTAKDDTDDSAGDENNADDEASDEDKEKEQSEPKLELVEENGGKSEFDLKNAGDDIKVNLESTGNTWLEVTGDGESLYYSMLNEEESPVELDLSGKNEIYFSIGNAGDLTITINDIELEYPVDPKTNVVQKITVNVNNDTDE